MVVSAAVACTVGEDVGGAGLGGLGVGDAAGQGDAATAWSEPVADSDGAESTTGGFPAGSDSEPAEEPTATSMEPGSTSDSGGPWGVGESTGEPSTGAQSAGAQSTGAEPEDASTSEDDGGVVVVEPQPADGMWAHCDIDAPDCANGLTCLTTTVNGVLDGYCSATPCSNPSLECDPAPAGATATPQCGTLEDGNPYCRLDCAVGSCPAGMLCTSNMWDGVTEATCV
ncbi:MAG: hypothetical protein AAF721_39395 [Myxococcota bacterium]